MDKLYGWMFEQIAIDGITLDVDSTVMTVDFHRILTPLRVVFSFKFDPC
jgi:hypothetical protein